MEPLDSESSALTTILPSPTTKRTPQKPSQIRFNKMEQFSILHRWIDNLVT